MPNLRATICGPFPNVFPSGNAAPGEGIIGFYAWGSDGRESWVQSSTILYLYGQTNHDLSIEERKRLVVNQLLAGANAELGEGTFDPEQVTLEFDAATGEPLTMVVGGG